MNRLLSALRRLDDWAMNQLLGPDLITGLTRYPGPRTDTEALTDALRATDTHT